VSNSDTDTPISPYKFLHYYEQEDQDIFFGRKAETRILLSDVVIARLVVLFAKTGTGKTSLINAGVRPILEERGYTTFFIRVKKDPVTSAKYEILSPENKKRFNKTLSWTGDTFAKQLESISSQLGNPIVLFFDQFEEFFIYPMDEEGQSKDEETAKRCEFVSNIAALYHGPEARVHIVFSMREEWFVEMDIFRDEIPKIFHNDSNLRLRWFNESQARDAIKLPAEEFGVTIEDEVINRMLDDITVSGEIEPAQLQIICDTLWRQTKGVKITLDDYVKLGDPLSDEPITRQVLFKRLEGEFEKNLEDDHLHLLYALLPKLRTPWKTKYVRDLPGLVRELTNDDADLAEIIKDTTARQELVEKVKEDIAAQPGLIEEEEGKGGPLTVLIQKLEKKIGLIRRNVRDGLKIIELSHDYLVDSLGDLQKRVRAIGPRRLLQEAMGRYGKSGELIDREVLERISECYSVLKFDTRQAEVLFLSALSQGLEKKLWFDQMPKEMAWRILEDKVSNIDKIDDCEHVIDLLGYIHTARAFELLERILPTTEMASYSIEVVSRSETSLVVHFLAKALEYESLMSQAKRVLSRIGKSRKHPSVAREAQETLEEFNNRQESRAKLGSESVPPPAADTSGDSHNSQINARGKGGSGLSNAALEPHYKTVINGFADGRVVPFLGAGVNMVNRRGSSWEPDEKFLPNSYDLAQYLVRKIGHIEQKGSYDLVRVSQYISIEHGQGVLYNELRRIFTGGYAPTSVHRFFASLPGILKEKNFPSDQLIVTTNYDDVLERTFTEAGEPFDVISNIAKGEQQGKFLHRPFNEEPRVIQVPNKYSLPKGRSVILKLSGSVDRENEDLDSFVITEDDYIDQLTLADAYSSIPIAIQARLQRSNFLFLGYSLREWNARVTLRQIWGERQRSYKSWAIQVDADLTDQAVWSSHGVDLFSVPLEDYIAVINEQIKAKPKSEIS
jgi:hypothetical protein